MLFLNVPYHEKEYAKALGARWNPQFKKWYATRPDEYYKFARWILPIGSLIVLDNLYLVEGIRTCFKCGMPTRLVALGVDKHIDLSDDDYGMESEEEFNNPNSYVRGIKLLDKNEDWLKVMNDFIDSDTIFISGEMNLPSGPLLDFLQRNYNYKMRYSYTTKDSDYRFCCDHCDILQGDFFVYHEVDTPFFLDSIEKIKALNIYRIPLATDMVFNFSLSYGMLNYLIKQYADISDLNLQL